MVYYAMAYHEIVIIIMSITSSNTHCYYFLRFALASVSQDLEAVLEVPPGVCFDFSPGTFFDTVDFPLLSSTFRHFL